MLKQSQSTSQLPAMLQKKQAEMLLHKELESQKASSIHRHHHQQHNNNNNISPNIPHIPRNMNNFYNTQHSQQQQQLYQQQQQQMMLHAHQHQQTTQNQISRSMNRRHRRRHGRHKDPSKDIYFEELYQLCKDLRDGVGYPKILQGVYHRPKQNFDSSLFTKYENYIENMMLQVDSLVPHLNQQH